MTGRSHSIISAFLCQFIAMVLFKDISIAPIVIGAICGLIADIDEDQSKISYMLIKGFGGKKRIKDVNYHKTDTKYNARIKLKRRIALSTVIVFISILLFLLSSKNIFFSFAFIYIAILPWTTHRSLSHSILSSVIIGGFSYLGFRQYNLPLYGIYVGIGYFLHIFEDMFTMSGVPLLYPFIKKKFRIPLMSTGSKKGALIELTFILISIALCFISFYVVFIK